MLIIFMTIHYKVIGMYLEGAADGRRLYETLRASRKETGHYLKKRKDTGGETGGVTSEVSPVKDENYNGILPKPNAAGRKSAASD